MSKKGDPIINGKICPYCKEETQYIDSVEIYKKDFGMVYYCKPCSAWVGVHKGTDVALGRLANAELRKRKQEAHKYFDPLWKHKMTKGYKKGKARRMAYEWLSSRLVTPKEETHIGWFDVDMCNKVIELCKPIVEQLNLKTYE